MTLAFPKTMSASSSARSAGTWPSVEYWPMWRSSIPACAHAGIELRHIGQYSTEGQVPAERALDDADIVFGKARVIYEAMACGRAAYVFDHNGGEGWVTRETYGALSADNFGGQAAPSVIDE